MKNWFQKNELTVIQITFLIPILLVAFVSISHVTTWYGLSNPVSWATYLSLAVEIAALSSLAGMTAGMRKFIYFPFTIVTLIQLLGNVFYSFHYINVNSELFKSWMDLTSPIFSMMGVDDAAGHRRILAFLSGGLLPIISLTFLHMLIKATDNKKKQKNEDIVKEENKEQFILNADAVAPPPAVIEPEKLAQIEEFLNKKITPDSEKTNFFPSETPLPSVTPTPEPTPLPTPEPEVIYFVEDNNLSTEPPTPEPTPTPEPSVPETPISEEDTQFTHVGGLLKKIQYDNPDRRQL